MHQPGAASDGEAVMDPAGAEGSKGLHNDDDEHELAETAVCAFVANNLHKRSNQGSWKPLQQGWKKREKKQPRRVHDPPLSFGEFIQGYRRSSPFQHDHRTCPIHNANTVAYKKAHRTKKRTSANIREAKMEVSKDELSKKLIVSNRTREGDSGDQESLGA